LSTGLIFVIFLYYRTEFNLSNKICFIIFRVQMNPIQIFEFAINWINQKIINLTRCYWAETARPRCTVHGTARMRGTGPAHGHALARAQRTAELLGEPAMTRHRCAGSGWGAATHRRGNGGRRRGVNERAPVWTAAGSARRSGRGWRGRGDSGAREAVEAAVGTLGALSRHRL
jgi:hypothetical protein